VSNIRVRSNFSAVMWGFMAGNDTITGDIIIKDQNGEVLDQFEVSAAYALGGLAGGQDDARMGWLYESFAEETLKELVKHLE
jgi:glucose dehydrogenase